MHFLILQFEIPVSSFILRCDVCVLHICYRKMVLHILLQLNIYLWLTFYFYWHSIQYCLICNKVFNCYTSIIFNLVDKQNIYCIKRYGKKSTKHMRFLMLNSDNRNYLKWIKVMLDSANHHQRNRHRVSWSWHCGVIGYMDFSCNMSLWTLCHC